MVAPVGFFVWTGDKPIKDRDKVFPTKMKGKKGKGLICCWIDCSFRGELSLLCRCHGGGIESLRYFPIFIPKFWNFQCQDFIPF